MVSALHPSVPPPGTYRFVVGSAAEAVNVIREKLGPEAKVLSVQPAERSGINRWLRAPQFEVVAELAAPAAPAEVGMSVAADASGGGFDAAALLRRAGLPEKLIVQVNASRRRVAADAPLHHVLADLRHALRGATERVATPLPVRTAFLGGAGVGRTTALCKWLAHETLTQGRQGAIWRVEFERPNPAPLLDVFAEALGAPVEHYLKGAGAPEADFLLADLPPLPAPGSREERDLRSLLDREEITGRVLVLNALYDPDVLRAAYVRGRSLGATHLVFTHLDELPRWGRLWEFLWGTGTLAPLFASLGPGLIGDFALDVPAAVLRRTLPGDGREAA